jgi:hypothetical protein
MNGESSLGIRGKLRKSTRLRKIAHEIARPSPLSRDREVQFQHYGCVD